MADRYNRRNRIRARSVSPLRSRSRHKKNHKRERYQRQSNKYLKDAIINDELAECIINIKNLYFKFGKTKMLKNKYDLNQINNIIPRTHQPSITIPLPQISKTFTEEDSKKEFKKRQKDFENLAWLHFRGCIQRKNSEIQQIENEIKDITKKATKQYTKQKEAIKDISQLQSSIITIAEELTFEFTKFEYQCHMAKTNMETLVEQHKKSETEKQKKFIINKNNEYKKRNNINDDNNNNIDWEKNLSLNIILVSPEKIKNGNNNKQKHKQKQKQQHQSQSQKNDIKYNTFDRRARGKNKR
eukprot:39803_1